MEHRIEGEQLIETFFNMLMAVRFHDNNNASVISASEDLLDLLSLFFSRGETFLTIKITSNRFFFQEERLYLRPENEEVFVQALQFFDERSIAEIKFLPTEEKITPQVLHKIALFLYHSIHASDPVLWLKKRLATESIRWFDVDKIPVQYQYELPYDGEKIKETAESYETGFVFDTNNDSARKIYAFALDTIKRMAKIVAGPNVTGIRKIQRLIEKMVDSIQEDNSILLAMSTTKDSEDYIYGHSVNVAILAVCFGLHLGLSRKSVEILGICGFFHDLGKVDIPVEIIQKTGPLSHEEKRIMEKHSLFSVIKILKMNTTRDLKALILRAPLEHHIKYDQSGYPELSMTDQACFFGRILTIVDVYEAITSPRAYRKTVLSPDEALAKMLESSGADYDPLLLKAFIHMLGIYPIGTFVQLDTGEMGIVTGKGKSSLGNRPNIVVIKTDNQKRLVKGGIINLEDRDSQTMAYIRNIIASFHPGRFGIQPAQFILG